MQKHLWETETNLTKTNKQTNRQTQKTETQEKNYATEHKICNNCLGCLKRMKNLNSQTTECGRKTLTLDQVKPM